MIRYEGVTKIYGENRAVDDVTLEVEAGEVCVLIGPSGSGKTTLMRMTNRLVEPSSGSVMVDGQNVEDVRPEELRRRMGYAIQSVGLFPHLTVAQNIATVPRLAGWDKSRSARRAEELLALFGLDPDAYGDKYPSQLSGGEAQRVGVARALAADPPVLLMDEPFGAVDPLTRERLQAEFARIQRELRKTVVFVTHDIDEAIRLADKIAIMREGRIVQHDTPETILEHPADKFVHDFVGSDRALKRLVRVKVSEVMRAEPPRVRMGTPSREVLAAGGEQRFVYLVDEAGRLTGWLDKGEMADEGLEGAITRVDRSEAAVRDDTSLKDALSRMLGMGFMSVPVVDEDGRLVGQVAFSDVERVLSGDGS